MENSPQCSDIHTAIKNQTWTLFTQKYAVKFKKAYPNELFTVVASLSLVDSHDNTHQLVSLGFGTKSLPQSVIQEHKKEMLLCDMHAEILAIQGFKKFLLKECPKKQSSFLQWVEKKQKYRLSPRYEVVLYCSELFCGDCCINESQQSFSGAKPLKYFKASEYPQLKYEPNILRTKPGRLDIPFHKRSPILCCSDLLGMTNLVGIQGMKLFNLMTPVYISTFIVQGEEKMRGTVVKGLDLVQRLSALSQRNESLVQRQTLNILVQKKQRKISSQFQRNRPKVVILPREKTEKHARDQEGFDLCGIMTSDTVEWINGKSGLPEGSSLKTYLNKGKISLFSEASLGKDCSGYREGKESFKYEAVRDRLKHLFGEWIDDV